MHIPDGPVQMLAAHIEKFGVYGAQQWLFVGRNGMPPHENTVGYWWRKTANEAGLSDGCMTCGASTLPALLLPGATW